MLTLQVIQHVPFEGPANIANWAKENHHTLQYTRMYKGESFPDMNSYDILVVMGGPMGVYSTEKYPWVDTELEYIKSVIDANKPVLGICLGAQFIAKALGAAIYKSPKKEIGWFTLYFDSTLPGDLKKILPETLETFHWHGDTFDIPHGAIKLAHSSAVPNQGFVYNSKVIALQFHLEMNESSISAMLKNCADDITEDPFVQTPAELESGLSNEPENRVILKNFLTYLSGSLN